MALRTYYYLVAFATLLCFDCFSQTTPQPGVIDATTFDFEHKRLNLSGTWIWYDNKLLKPDELEFNNGVPTQVPGTWNECRANKSGQGYATYELTLILPPVAEQVSLEMPDMYSSYVLFANGKEITRNGTPGKTLETTTPQWRPRVIPLLYESDTVQLVLQIANFHHHKGGMKEPIMLGFASLLAQKEFLSLVGKAIAVGLLLILAIGFFIVYFRYGMKPVVIYFSMLCFTWVARSMFSNDYMITKFFPDFNWNLAVRIEYITLYFEMIWAVLFLVELFKNEGNRVVKYILVAFNLGFTIYTLVTPSVEFTTLLPLYLITAGVLLVYGAGVVLVALVNERRGATFLTISVMLGLLIYSYDIFAYEGWFSYNSVVFSSGYLVIFLLMGIALLLHLGIIKGNNTATTMLTYKDLYGEEDSK
jgi:hypothetical protein